jgi:hypothetical protein
MKQETSGGRGAAGLFFPETFFLLHVQVRCTGISQAEFYAAVESLRVDGPTV